MKLRILRQASLDTDVCANVMLHSASATDSEVPASVISGSVFGNSTAESTFKSTAYEVQHTMPLSDTTVDEALATSSASSGKLELSSTSEPVELQTFSSITPTSVSSTLQCSKHHTEQPAEHNATFTSALFSVELAEVSTLETEVPSLASSVEVPSMSTPRLASVPSPQPGYFLLSFEPWAASAVHLLTTEAVVVTVSGFVPSTRLPPWDKRPPPWPDPAEWMISVSSFCDWVKTKCCHHCGEIETFVLFILCYFKADILLQHLAHSVLWLSATVSLVPSQVGRNSSIVMWILQLQLRLERLNVLGRSMTVQLLHQRLVLPLHQLATSLQLERHLVLLLHQLLLQLQLQSQVLSHQLQVLPVVERQKSQTSFFPDDTFETCGCTSVTSPENAYDGTTNDFECVKDSAAVEAGNLGDIVNLVNERSSIAEKLVQVPHHRPLVVYLQVI